MKLNIKRWIPILVFLIAMLFACPGEAEAASPKLNKTSVTAYAGTSFTLTVKKSTAKVTWSSSNTAVATVSRAGVVTPVNNGSCKITAKVGKKKLTCKVVVKRYVSSIELSAQELTLNQSEKKALTASVMPANASNRSITWKSSDTKIAKVTSRGVVEAVGCGTAVITAKAVDGSGVTAACTVTVEEKKSNKAAAAVVEVVEEEDLTNYRNIHEIYTMVNSFRTGDTWYWGMNSRTKITVTGLSALTVDPRLERIARRRAREQWIQYWKNGKLTHDRPDGKSCWASYDVDYYCAENLAWASAAYSSRMVLDMWIEEDENYYGQGHRRNMLMSNAKTIGVACYEENGVTCWAMCLGK